MGETTITQADIALLFERMYASAHEEPNYLYTSTKDMNKLRRAYAIGKRQRRWLGIYRRQRRAAQRKHNWGENGSK